VPDRVLLEELHASGVPSLDSTAVLIVFMILFLRRRTSLSLQCHTVNITSTPSNTRLYVFRNLRLNNMASTIFRNLGSLPGSSGSTSSPPPAVVCRLSLSGQGTPVEAVAWRAKRKASRSHGVSSMAAAVRYRTADSPVLHVRMSRCCGLGSACSRHPRGSYQIICAGINFLVEYRGTPATCGGHACILSIHPCACLERCEFCENIVVN
jgi:hypothetical protein